MGRNMPLAFAAALALAGCGQLWPAGGNSAAETVNAAPTGNGIVFTGDSGQSTDAGITDQSTLASLMGNAAGDIGENIAAPIDDAPGPDAALPGKPTPAAIETASRPVGIDPSLLIGRWGDNGNCAQAIELRGDGTFITPTGAVGNWSLNGDSLTMSGPNGSFQARLRAVDRAHLVLVNPNGSIGRSQRC